MAYIHPRIDGDITGYFDWVGAAMYSADRRTSAMHGREFVLQTIYAGIDPENFYGRVDIEPQALSGDLEIFLNLGVIGGKGSAGSQPRIKVTVPIQEGRLGGWSVARVIASENDGQGATEQVLDSAQLGVSVRWKRILEFQVPLKVLGVTISSHQNPEKVTFQCAAWKNKLPIDSLPAHGAIEIAVVEEEALEFVV
jgi:hypothetical protein